MAASANAGRSDALNQVGKALTGIVKITEPTPHVFELEPLGSPKWGIPMNYYINAKDTQGNYLLNYTPSADLVLTVSNPAYSINPYILRRSDWHHDPDGSSWAGEVSLFFLGGAGSQTFNILMSDDRYMPHIHMNQAITVQTGTPATVAAQSLFAMNTLPENWESIMLPDPVTTLIVTNPLSYTASLKGLSIYNGLNVMGYLSVNGVGIAKNGSGDDYTSANPLATGILSGASVTIGLIRIAGTPAIANPFTTYWIKD